uniref:C2 domain-containing protein n=1 Tax=Pavo cristatus TaxID=9049 RepID=A0A8C9F9F6_PAVCR
MLPPGRLLLGSAPGDIPASTSLPPLVEGPPRCVLRCTVGRIVWTAAKPPSAAVLVRLRWWGETSDGTVFHPASKPGQAAGSSRYAVRCGPRQLAAYLTGESRRWGFPTRRYPRSCLRLTEELNTHNTDAREPIVLFNRSPSIKLNRKGCQISYEIDCRNCITALSHVSSSCAHSADLSPVHFWDQPGSLLDSLSVGSEVYDSELNDPHYDQSLLESLFYTTPKSDSSWSDFLSDEDVNPSKKGSKARFSLCSCSPTRQLAPPDVDTEEAGVTSLSVDRLALLGRIHLARVIIESLRIPLESSQITPRKKGLMGKPPRPASVNKCTFFVEYHFPVGASKNEKGQVSLTTELTRIASSKVTDGEVKFQQRFVFPVRFGGTMIEHWWSSDLAFKIYMRKSTQRKPVAIGSAVLQLCKVIQSELLAFSCEIPVEKEGDQIQVGPLKVSVELAADNKDFTCTTARCSVAVQQQVPPHAIRSPRMELWEPNRHRANAGSCLKFNNHVDSEKTGAACTNVVQPPRSASTPVARNLMTQLPAAEDYGLFLHVLLMVPDGKDFVAENSGLHASCNVYLNCKLLNTEEATRSAVVWGTTQPTFNFSQVMPFALTSKHLERLKNNVMVIEAWHKMGSPGNDRLLGLVKLPLHQFYISFKDPKVSHLLLQAHYPVVAVDSYMPVIDVFTGSKSGSLRVVLAMGSADQIVALQRLKNEEGMEPPITQRPAHFLDPPPTKLPVVLFTEFPLLLLGTDGKNFTSLFINRPNDPQSLCIELKPFRTATTLCVPDPVFNDEHHHSLLVPADVPVQRLLVSAFMAPGAVGGGIQFEVWCRYYYPNVRDQLVAKGTLPLSRLCAMITMQHREEIGIQTFNLPLVPRTDSSEEFHLRSTGLLDVSVRYQRSVKTTAGRTAQTVSLSVQIHRAAGLQAAPFPLLFVGSLQVLQGHNEVSPQPSLLQAKQAQFPQPFFIGEVLVSKSCIAVWCICNFICFPATDTLAARTSRDYLLGTVTVPTRDLLRRRSGITGWYPVTLSEDAMPSHRTNIMQAVVGGLELSVTFAHHNDRGRVLEAAQLLGWNSEESLEDSMDESDEWEPSDRPVVVTISTPRVWLPLHCVLLAGQMQLSKSTCCYLRYKLYDQEATWTLLKRPKLCEDKKNVTVNFKKGHKVTLRKSQGLIWFFREEKLEIQVWWAYGKENGVERPLDTDRLIGSAYVDLRALAERSRRTLSVGVYPLFRCNAADLAGAAVRVHIALSSTSAAPALTPHCTEEHSNSEGESTERAPDPSQRVSEDQGQNLDVRSSEITNGKPQEDDVVFLDSTIAVSILVERAMHLSLKGSPLTEREVAAPSSCVSFAVAGADAPITTPVIENTESPVWDFQQQARWLKLIHALYSSSSETERVIGFASVDLSPLLSGFQLVCGWYNITDFSGQCRGQIKVAVSPLQSISNLKGERQARIRAQTPSSAVRALLSYPVHCLVTSALNLWDSEVMSKHSKLALLQWISTGIGYIRSSLNAYMLICFTVQTPNTVFMYTPLTRRMWMESFCHRFLFFLFLFLTTAYRKNLNELDEVQRYFSQKLTRSLPDFSDGNRSQPSHGEQESEHQGLRSKEMDPNRCHLLRKSSQLVSQVSSLISGKLSLGLGFLVLEASSKSSCNGGEHPARCVQGDGGAFAQQPHSEEEYEEEDIIEPRALNEITTLTDRTSPWSSVLSVELGADQQPAGLQPEGALKITQHFSLSFFAWHPSDPSSLREDGCQHHWLCC